MSKQSYSEKLRDPRWQKKRLEIMRRADFKCEDCGAADKTLNVHHSLYRSGVEPWEAWNSTLRCVCEDCHEGRQGTEREAVETFKAVCSVLAPVEIDNLRRELIDRFKLRMTIRDEFIGAREIQAMESGELTKAGLPPIHFLPPAS